MTMKSISRVSITAVLLAAITIPAAAQGKSKGAEKSEKPAAAASKGSVAKGPKKVVTSSQAVLVTREVLVANGFQVVRVVPSGTTQVIYYRRGNRGNGRGLGPVEKIVVVPSGDVVRFQSVPEAILGTILRRLGM
jgi:hypothetical protein